MKFKFNSKYCLLAIILFTIELLIALFVHDRFIRPFVGDVIVMLFMFTALRTFLEVKTQPLAIGLFIFATAVEIGQYFNLVKLLGLQNNKIASTIIGTSFDPHDILAYGIGTVVTILIFKKRLTQN